MSYWGYLTFERIYDFLKRGYFHSLTLYDLFPAYIIHAQKAYSHEGFIRQGTGRVLESGSRGSQGLAVRELCHRGLKIPKSAFPCRKDRT